MTKHFQSIVMPTSAESGMAQVLAIHDLARLHLEDYELILPVIERSSLSDQLVAAVESGRLQRSRIAFVAAKSGQSAFAASLEATYTAIGDRVSVVINPPEDLNQLVILWGGAESDVVMVSPSSSKKSIVWEMYSKIFGALYKRSTGFRLMDSDFEIVDMSRKFVGVLQRSSVPEATLRSSSAIAGITSRQIRVDFAKGRKRLRFAQQFSRALETLWSSSVTPLRLVSLFSLLAAGLNLIYSFYVVGVSLTQSVERGWTSMSLQISGMFLITLLVLAALTEFLIYMNRSLNSDPHALIVGEINSPGGILGQAINVEQGKK